MPLPFTVDLVAPEPGAFVAEEAFVVEEEPLPVDEPVVEVEAAPIEGGSAPFVPGLPPAAPLPETAPLAGLDTATGADVVDAPAPALAVPRPAAVRPASTEDAARDGVELLAVLAEKLSLSGGLWDVVAAVDLNYVGYAIAALFVVTWAVALAVWRLGRIEERWTAHLGAGAGDGVPR